MRDSLPLLDISETLLEERKQLTQNWFENLRDQICQKFMALEQNYCKDHFDKTPGQFIYTPWTRQQGGVVLWH